MTQEASLPPRSWPWGSSTNSDKVTRLQLAPEQVQSATWDPASPSTSGRGTHPVARIQARAPWNAARRAERRAACAWPCPESRWPHPGWCRCSSRCPAGRPAQLTPARTTQRAAGLPKLLQGPPAQTPLLSTGASCTCSAASSRNAPASATTCSTGAMLAQRGQTAHARGASARPSGSTRASRNREEKLQLSSDSWRARRHFPALGHLRACAVRPLALPGRCGRGQILGGAQFWAGPGVGWSPEKTRFAINYWPFSSVQSLSRVRLFATPLTLRDTLIGP